jgi:type IV secretion system protein VirB4
MLGMSKANGADTRPGRNGFRPRHWVQAQAENPLARFIPFSSLVSPHEPLLNFEWVDSVVFELAGGVKGGRSPAQRTLDAGCQPVRWLSWPMRHADASAMTSRSVSYA